ncbi:FAD-dependent oxidoreductase [Nocardia huaxiensis]|uniref:FAD-dependent oxidoreductase n=1 Tax=Nocardia huaxiensis TaxID=2755382 RepID=A0A7D6ZMG1_9NOCA|nr:FAD-dependent oxidoreductase [Nocardia huaxiensis]QLY34147.1 FAD-dependent oxidoreductase [Nocardia huaxiensis]
MTTGHITVIGGGLAGLTAAIACAESGVRVKLYEAHATLGGRARATAAPHIAHDGAHVFYADGPHYTWLRKRGFVAGLGWPSIRDAGGLGFRVDGRLRRLPPVRMLRAQARFDLTAPVDVEFRTWASNRWGETTAGQLANAISVVTYDADTGRLSAAFVWDLVQRALGPRVPAIRWVRGGWQMVVDRMAARAVELGVVIETGSRVTELSTAAGPVIVATELASARGLLHDDTLIGTSGHAALLDFAVHSRPGDRTAVFDLDEGGYHESYTMQDDTIAPPGQSLFQLQMPVRHKESHADAHRRLAIFADAVVPGRCDRMTFSRTAIAKGRTGALDLPGRTWRDRPAVERGDGLFLAGDMVAAPGMRGEISINSALHAAASAVKDLESRRIRAW